MLTTRMVFFCDYYSLASGIHAYFTYKTNSPLRAKSPAAQLCRRTKMNWGDIIFSLLALAGVFVLVVIIFVLKAEKQVKNEKASQKQSQPRGRD
jgi:hypothetical protein